MSDPGSDLVRAVSPHFLVDGPADGAPILLANSLGSDSRIWRPQLTPLVDRGFRVVRHDTRGHGGSPVPPGPYRIDDLGADALAVLDALGVEAAHVVGVSLGGMTGLWLAAHAPHRVRTLTVCCTSAHPGNPRRWLDRAARARAGGMAEIAEASVARWFTPGWRAANPGATRELRELTAGTPAEGYAGCCEALAGLDLRPDLPRISAPTLVIAAAEDPAFGPDHGRLIAARVPGARFELLQHAAHLATVEQPERCTDLIIQHLGGTP